MIVLAMEANLAALEMRIPGQQPSIPAVLAAAKSTIFAASVGDGVLAWEEHLRGKHWSTLSLLPHRFVRLLLHG